MKCAHMKCHKYALIHMSFEISFFNTRLFGQVEICSLAKQEWICHKKDVSIIYYILYR